MFFFYEWFHIMSLFAYHTLIILFILEVLLVDAPLFDVRTNRDNLMVFSSSTVTVSTKNML